MTRRNRHVSRNRVFVLSSGEKIAFVVKGIKENVLFVKNAGGELVIATGGNPVGNVHETLQAKVVPQRRATKRETYGRVVEIAPGEAVELTVAKFHNQNHVYAVERGGKLTLVGGASLVSKISGEGLSPTAP